MVCGARGTAPLSCTFSVREGPADDSGVGGGRFAMALASVDSAKRRMIEYNHDAAGRPRRLSRAARSGRPRRAWQGMLSFNSDGGPYGQTILAGRL